MTTGRDDRRSTRVAVSTSGLGFRCFSAAVGCLIGLLLTTFHRFSLSSGLSGSGVSLVSLFVAGGGRTVSTGLGERKSLYWLFKD